MTVQTVATLLALAESILVAAAYVASTYTLGKWVVRELRSEFSGLALLCRFSVGAALLGTAITLLAMVHLAFAPVVLTVAFTPLAIALVRRPRSLGMPAFRGLQAGWTAPHLLTIACIGLVASYAVPFTLAPPRGGDMAIYHLVVVRTVAWEHGLVFNPFSHDAGLYYGWQLFALPAYLLGGDRAFQLCSLFAYGILLVAAYRFIAARQGRMTGLVAALAVAGIVAGTLRESVVNNDIPLALLELGLLALAFALPPRPGSALLAGFVGGFCVAVKLIAVASLPLAYAALWWRAAGRRYTALLAMGMGTLASLAPWPTFNIAASGSPLPHFLLVWPPDSGYLPAYRESIGYMMAYFGTWYEGNVGRLFTQGMVFLPMLLAGIVAGPLTEAGRKNRLFLALVLLALAHGLVLVSLNGFNPAVLYHDRYHLSSYVLLGIAGVIGWQHALASVAARWPRASATLLVAAILTGSIYLFRAPVSMVEVRGPGEDSTIVQARSLKRILTDSARDMLQPPGGGRGGIGYDLAASVLPRDAVVATTVIDPYLLDRRFLQMLPVSENLVDLSASPEHLLEELRRHGATHLYLTEFSGLNPWMNPVVDRSLRSLRAIPQLPGVHRLFYLNYSSGKGRQGLYALHQDDAIPLQGEIRNFRLQREPDGTRTVLWDAAPGAEIEVNWLQAPGQKALMGYADSAIGQFPLRLGMPERYTLEAIVRAKGKPAQRHILQADAPR